MHPDPSQVATGDAFTLPAALSPAHAFTAGPADDLSRRQKLRLGRLVMGIVCAAIFCLLELLLVAQGFFEADVALQTAALAGVASIGFYLLFRSGLNERARDPSLTGPMLATALAILFSTMALSSTAFETFGIFIALILLFGAFRFSGRELLLYALGSLIAYGGLIEWRRQTGDADANHAMDVARWLVLAGALPVFAWVAGHIHLYRRQMDERKAFHQAVWDACSDVVVVVDGDGILRYVNPAASEVFGHAAAELTGGALSQLQPPRLADSGQGTLTDRALAPRPLGRPDTTEAIGWHRDGRPLPIEATFSTIVLKGHRVVVGFLRDIAERKEAEQRIRYMAGHDPLTGLPNRALLKDRITQAIADARRARLSVWVAFVDIDRFKLINDSLGHGAGDVVLTTVASRLRSALRDGDTVARLGGDEFVLVLTEKAAGGLTPTLVQRLLDAVAQPLATHGHELLPTCSIGIAVFPEDGLDAGTLIEHADITMYRAKQQGRGSFCFYAASMNEQARERLVIERELRIALERGEFVLHYQPQIELKSGRIVGVEALVRWAHPHRGLVPPAEFIGIAEDMGLIVEMGGWVLKEACRQNRAWQLAGLPPMRVAVNLSARQFANPDLAESIGTALSETDLQARYLEVEITESLVMSDVDRTVDTLGQLKRLGVYLSIDDFGTGYSSLAYLRRFPIDALKIDRSFVRDISSDPEDAAIIDAIISLARSLGRTVVAEGVEDRSQLGFLRSHGCDIAQGFLFSRPVPAAELQRYLESKGHPERSATDSRFRELESL